MLKDTQQQKQFKILVIGDACLDVYFFGSCERLSPEAPVPIIKKSKIKSYQGMCLNVASNIRAFGHKVSIDKNKEKITKTRIVDEKTGHHLLRVDDEPKIKNIDIRKYTKNAMIDFDALVISDYNKGFILKGDILDIIEPAKIRGIPIFVDSKKRDLSSFEGCIIKINQNEFNLVTKFPKKCDLIVTLGKDGARYDNKIYPVTPTEVHDVCGAGDVFLASFVHKYLETDGNIEKSIFFANKCAAISVGHFGTYTINPKEII